MVNMQPGGMNQQQWFPQLPEGYTGQPMQGMPGMNTQFQGGQGIPGYETQGFTSQYGMPGFGMPGYGGTQGFPSQSGMPGFGMPGYGMPGYGMPGYGNQGYPGGYGMPGYPYYGSTSSPGMPGYPNMGSTFPGYQHHSPMDPPPGHRGQHPGRGSQGQQQGSQPPTGPPPSRTPEYPEQQLFAVDPGAIAGCLYRYTYVWLSRRQGFWYYPTFVGRTSVAGYRWRSLQRRWEYFGIDLERINSFTCR